MRLSTATTRTFRFNPDVAMRDVAQTLELSRIAAESLFGAERVQIECSAHVGDDQHQVTIEAGTKAGRALAILFFAYAKREYGPQAVEIGGGQ